MAARNRKEKRKNQTKRLRQMGMDLPQIKRNPKVERRLLTLVQQMNEIRTDAARNPLAFLSQVHGGCCRSSYFIYIQSKDNE